MSTVRRPGWWYPYIFVAVFGVVVAVNATMVWLAGTTFSGLSVEQAYDKGVTYNRVLAAARNQEALGWAVATETRPTPDSAAMIITQTYRTRDGQPIDGLRVRGHLSRPATRGYDRDLVLAASAPGTYVARVSVPLPGLWDLEAVAQGEGTSYQSYQRFVAP